MQIGLGIWKSRLPEGSAKEGEVALVKQDLAGKAGVFGPNALFSYPVSLNSPLTI